MTMLFAFDDSIELDLDFIRDIIGELWVWKKFRGVDDL